MRFDVLTLFPEMFPPVLCDSVVGNAVKKGIIEFNFINIRDFSTDKHKSVDDYAYGGGVGMVMRPEPVYYAWKSITDNLDYKPKTIYLTPQGKLFTQSRAKKLAKMKHIILLCGHYEGIDERVLEEIVDVEISVGDFVLTGGEIPAMAVIDATARLIDGVLPSSEAYSSDSLYNNLLEHPLYTRPLVFLGKSVPEVLLSGHHKNIEKWKREQSVAQTLSKRRSLLRRATLTDDERRNISSAKYTSTR